MNNSLNNERGAVLITTLLLIVIITLIGLIAINTATVDIQISGQTKRSSMAFGGAEAGVDLAIPVIEGTLASGALVPPAPTGIITALDTGAAPNLLGEITASSDYNTDTASGSPDITAELNGVDVQIDIDRLYSYQLPGGAIEFAAGYEGVGAGAAGGGTGVIYRIDSQGTL